MKSLSSTSAWPASQVERYLQSDLSPLRLAVLDSSGFPLICSLWFIYEEDRILCATTRAAKVARCVEANPKCGFELAPNEPPYFGVRGQGVATVSSVDAMGVLGRLVDRYLGTRDSKFASWLLNREEDEVVLSIEPRWMTSWDFSDRMSA